MPVSAQTSARWKEWKKGKKMGIYIKTMEKPKNCGLCRLGEYVFGGRQVKCGCAPIPPYKAYSDRNLTPDWCPIEEVTDEEITAGRNLLAAFEDDGK